MDHFVLHSEYQPTGDQPQAIEELVKGFQEGNQCETLLGVTGSGKTFTMANVIAQLNKPTLILAHNKTLAAQLYSEFKAFFPHNAVEYFVSYYDYYQPEAYVPSTDTYIAKDSAINDEIDKLLSGEITLEELADEAAASGSGEQEASASAPQQETGAVSSPAGSSASSGSAASRTESSSTASSSKQETAGTANSGTEKPASSSGKQEAGYEAEVKALLRQLYSVKARAEAELNSCIAGAKAEFKSLPESQQTQARKISIVLARSGRLYAMQASYDREVESIVSQMRAILTANGQSTALADQAMASYKAQKSAMYSRLTAKLYS